MITKNGIKNAWTNNNIAPTNEIVTLYHGI